MSPVAGCAACHWSLRAAGRTVRTQVTGVYVSDLFGLLQVQLVAEDVPEIVLSMRVGAANSDMVIPVGRWLTPEKFTSGEQ